MYGKRANFLTRWVDDLRELTAQILSDPFALGQARRWSYDFAGEIQPSDIRYAIFIVVLNLIPAAIVAVVSYNVNHDPQWKALAKFFGAPIQIVITGFLSSSLIFLGSHVNQAPKPYPVAFKLMLRTMAVYPFLTFLNINSYGAVLSVLAYGFFVIRGVRKTYNIPLRNCFLFYGVTYLVFALLQLQALLSPPPSPEERLKSYSKNKTAETFFADRS